MLVVNLANVQHFSLFSEQVILKTTRREIHFSSVPKTVTDADRADRVKVESRSRETTHTTPNSRLQAQHAHFCAFRLQVGAETE